MECSDLEVNLERRIRAHGMFNLLSSKKSSGAGPLQGYKITNVDRSKKYGVAADSLRMLKTKASEKFKVNDLDKGVRDIYKGLLVLCG